jgi:hypothetical protein
MAVEFNMPIADTISGVQLYFLPQRFNFDNSPITSQSFQLSIWSSLNPAQLIFEQERLYKPLYTNDHGFVTFWLDTLIPVPQTFYVGFKAIGPLSLNLGYDLNNNHRDKFFWSLNGQNWNSPSANIFDGCVMLRPVFRKKEWGVGFNKRVKARERLTVFPNPAKNFLNFKVEPATALTHFQLFDLQGRLVLHGYEQERINVTDVKRGLYLLRLHTSTGQVLSKKVLLTE